MSEIVQSPPHLPHEALRPAWRAAALAYRGARQAGHLDLDAREAAEAAFTVALPDLPAVEVSREVANAIAYAAREHTRLVLARCRRAVGKALHCLGVATISDVWYALPMPSRRETMPRRIYA